MGPAPRPLITRFMEKVEVAESGCWLWTASRRRNSGYASFYSGHRGRRGGVENAHRVAYRMFRGPVPEGLELDHLCNVRHCVNPAHLEPVTRSENMSRGRQRDHDRGWKCGGMGCRVCKSDPAFLWSYQRSEAA